VSFRLRVTLLAATAVAIAVIGAAALMYLVVQRQLVAQIDRTLIDSAKSALTYGPHYGERFPFAGGSRGGPLLSGRQEIFAQVVDTSGRVVRSDYQPIPDLVTTGVRDVARGTRDDHFFDVTLPVEIAGEREEIRLRVYATPFGDGQALEVARPLNEIDAALNQTRATLLALVVGGILLAAGLGALVSRAALAPVARLTATVEEVAHTRDLSRRVAASGRDELGRLAESFDAMLGALESSVRSQRQLVADASHELRTPLTSLRTNLELLARGQPATESERRQVLVDLVSQMERLSALVADLIDLARDEEAPLAVEELRLDEIVGEAVDAMRSRYPHVRFQVHSQPTQIRGVRPRIARAVTNLLDNAAKWSPAGAPVEISVGDGEVAVRDHGPGVAKEDAPRVFDRFWRASNARHLPGSGLGLSIVKDVADSHGGSVTLENPAGGGARFRLRIGGARA
jgi:two-component system sensor histidine kinase MprB